MMKLNKKQLWASLIMTILVSATVLITVTMINVASANPDTYFFVDPPEVRNKNIADLFLIYINVSDAPDTYAWEITISWDNETLEVLHIMEGSFLDDQGPTSFSYVPFDEAQAAGEIVVGCSLLGDPGSVTWASGNGYLFQLGFNTTAQGSCVLDLFKTRLYDHMEAGYPAFTYYPNQDGFFTNMEIHDVAVTSVTANTTSVQPGQTVNITVTVENEGNYTENFNVAVYADATVYNKSVGWWPDEILVGDEITIDTYSVTSLAEGATNTTTNINWNTTGLAAETYTISANVTLTSPADDDPRDNMFIDGTVKFLVDHDLKVTDVTVLTPEVIMGELANMTVNVENQGTNSESFILYVNASGTNFNTTSVSSLSAGANSTYLISWDTTGFAGTYTISANVPPVPGEREVDKADNTLVDGTVKVTIHDLNVTDVTAQTPMVYEKWLLNMSVTVLNEGTGTETFVLYVYANRTKPINYTVATIAGCSIDSGASSTYSVSWNTTGVTWGWYNISVYASPHPDEVDRADNSVIDVWVHVLIPGDLDCDGDVDWYDLWDFAANYMKTE